MFESLRKRNTSLYLTPLLLVVPARLVLASRVLQWSDIAGAAAAYAAWVLLPRVWVRRAAPLVLSGALVLGELAPFHFDARHAGAFDWVPFRGLFQSTWQAGLVMLFRKSFWYGSVPWLWRASGRSLVWATGLAAAALFVLELAQVYLPGRTAEITDALLAGLMGLLLWVLRDA